jgi:hypothetical protein
MNNMRTVNPNVERLTMGNTADIYGCCGVFDLCGDRDLLSLSFSGMDPLLDYIGWEVTDVCVLERNFIDRVLPSEATRAGWVGDACATPNSVEWAAAAFRIEDFGRLRRSAPVQDVTKNHLRLCEAQPRYRLDGSLIKDDREYRAVMVGEVLAQDMKLMLVNGNVATAGQFDGLEQLVKTGYTDFKGRRVSAMDSIVINWNNNPLSGGSGMTWTDGRGQRAISATASFTDVLRSAVRIIKNRIKNSGLGVMNLQMGDMVLVATSEAAEAIMDQFTCWSVCEGGQYNEANLNTIEARAFRENLMGGTFRAASGATIQAEGMISVNGVTIPIISYDWGLQTGSYSDAYLLTGSVGTRRVLTGQFNDMRQVPVSYEDVQKYWYSDGGKVLGWSETGQTCLADTMEWQPRLVSPAPWTNIRFVGLSADSPGGAIEFDPLSTSFFPGGGSFEVASCN